MVRVGRLYWWERIPGRAWRVVASVAAADEIPVDLPQGAAVLVGSRKHPKWLAFDCPCRTGHRVMVTLDRANDPHWIIVNEKKLSIWPSIDYRSPDRRCHYLIQRGKIIWVTEKEERRRGRKR